MIMKMGSREREETRLGKAQNVIFRLDTNGINFNYALKMGGDAFIHRLLAKSEKGLGKWNDETADGGHEMPQLHSAQPH